VLSVRKVDAVADGEDATSELQGGTVIKKKKIRRPLNGRDLFFFFFFERWVERIELFDGDLKVTEK
jgi:hypothetical protein